MGLGDLPTLLLTSAAPPAFTRPKSGGKSSNQFRSVHFGASHDSLGWKNTRASREKRFEKREKQLSYFSKWTPPHPTLDPSAIRAHDDF